MGFNNSKSRRIINHEKEVFEEMKIMIPKGTAAKLRALSDLRGQAVSRLAAIAIDNELTEAKIAFAFPSELPKTEYVEYAYQDDAQKICEFLKRIEGGIGRESLVLCRRDMGIESREVLLYAYRELLMNEIIEEYTPKQTGFRRGRATQTCVRIRGANQKVKL